ncbi:MAG: LysR substrate-binding domain-containing protein [Cohaesibacter sp.]|nr:LysR substrate-binding domain-containing protein [Cohaesibacter sp.]MCV6601466.1 LysR substrate-binding domain-containing protein [Cohaesibacter sp.]
MLTLRQLSYFDALAKEQHFGRAAERVAVSQPALSVQIRELETHLGLQLVERFSGGARLTEAGKDVLEKSRQILLAVQELETFGQTRQGPLNGPFRLGVIPSIGPYLLPDMLPRLRTHYPHLELILRESRTTNLISELSQGHLDAAILALPLEEDNLKTQALFEDPFYLATPKQPDAPAAISATAIPMDDLLLLEEGHCLRDQALQACSIATNPLMKSFGASSLTTLIQLITNGYASTLLPQMCIEKEAGLDHISLIPFLDPAPSRTIGLAWRKSAPTEQDFTALANIIKNR